MKVTAGDKGTGKSESITITNDKGRLTQEEIDRMVQEAEKYADEDKATKERIEARNGLENYAFSLKNQVNDEEGLGGKIDEDDKETVSFLFLLLDLKSYTNTIPSFSRPSRRPPNGSTPTPPRPRPLISRSKRRSFLASPTQSPASSTATLVQVDQVVMTSQLITTSCKLEKRKQEREPICVRV